MENEDEVIRMHLDTPEDMEDFMDTLKLAESYVIRHKDPSLFDGIKNVAYMDRGMRMVKERLGL